MLKCTFLAGKKLKIHILAIFLDKKWSLNSPDVKQFMVQSSKPLGHEFFGTLKGFFSFVKCLYCPSVHLASENILPTNSFICLTLWFTIRIEEHTEKCYYYQEKTLNLEPTFFLLFYIVKFYNIEEETNSKTVKF